MRYEKADAKITVFDNIEFMANSSGTCEPVVGTVVCKGGFSCVEVTAGGKHQFYCTGYTSTNYNAKSVGGSGKWECDPVECTNY